MDIPSVVTGQQLYKHPPWYFVGSGEACSNVALVIQCIHPKPESGCSLCRPSHFRGLSSAVPKLIVQGWCTVEHIGVWVLPMTIINNEMILVKTWI